jgi:hypothetical protein
MSDKQPNSKRAKKMNEVNVGKVVTALTRENGLTIAQLTTETGLSNSQVRRALKDTRFEKMQDRGGLIWWRLVVKG